MKKLVFLALLLGLAACSGSNMANYSSNSCEKVCNGHMMSNSW